MTDRPHGYARYKLDGCRCYVCGWARSEYDLDRQQQIADGTWQPFVDAEPVRAHVRSLMDAGIGRRRVAELAAVTQATVSKIMWGVPSLSRPPTRRVRREIAERLLAVAGDWTNTAPHTIIDATGTRRRIQGLAANGWTLTAQAQRIGWRVSNFAALTDAETVTRSTAGLVAEMYEQLCMTAAPDGYGARRILAIARSKGWFRPMAWDDETIDDPAAVPCLAPADDFTPAGVDERAVQHYFAGHDVQLDRLTRREVIRRLRCNGWKLDELAAEFGISKERARQLSLTPAGSPS